MKRLILLLVLFASCASADIRHPGTVTDFKRLSGFPNGRPGFVADHMIPLCLGGPDTVDNLKWQKEDASYAKDAFERALCKEMDRQGYYAVKIRHRPGNN